MNNFIEIHIREEKVLVNTMWIQQIFDETYDEVMKKIEGAGT